MFDKRIKVFIFISLAALAVCLARLAQLQIKSNAEYLAKVEQLKEQRNSSQQLKTLRGKILDRNGVVLATDEPRFFLEISYTLTSATDQRLTRAKMLLLAAQEDSAAKIIKAQEELADRAETLNKIIDKCSHFGIERMHLEGSIKEINDRIWNLRTFIAWRRNGPSEEIVKKYGGITSVSQSAAIADFEKKIPDADKRFKEIAKVNDIVETEKSYPLLELNSDEDIFNAQFTFVNTDGIEIRPEGKRIYPYNSTASQIIGWVGLPQGEDEKLFADDKLSSYLGGEVCGREDGVEYVCEGILRGRRGEVVYDIDRQLKTRTETQFGQDVRLTIDIELQKKIEEYLLSPANPKHTSPMAAAVIDVASGEILAMVSLPTYNLNSARGGYGTLLAAAGKPLINRAINEAYPPGSVIKPIIFIAGAESAAITPEAIISCPAQSPPRSWPACWIQRRYSWLGHDEQWTGEGGNNARNAMRGSCNIYFSRLADRIEPLVLQKWLYAFGYGRRILPGPGSIGWNEFDRNFRQFSGVISSSNPAAGDPNFDQLPELKTGERRWFGIGQGNMRVTPLQVANAMATIVRGGLYMQPRIFAEQEPAQSISLDLSPQTIKTVYEGMRAVVVEPHGTAYEQFRSHDFASQGITVYGKTGSTERPEHAWFAGFAEETGGRSVALAVLVEGGQQGSQDAAPLARDIFQFCIDAGYIGSKKPQEIQAN